MINKGIIDKKYGKLYNKLYYLREEADYSLNLQVSTEEVKKLIEETEIFLKTLEKTIKNI